MHKIANLCDWVCVCVYAIIGKILSSIERLSSLLNWMDRIKTIDEIKTVSWNCSTNGNSAEVRRKNMISSWKSSHKKLLWNSIAWSLSNHRAENEDHSGNTHAVQKNHDGIRTKTNQNEIFSNEFHRDDCRVPFCFFINPSNANGETYIFTNDFWIWNEFWFCLICWIDFGWYKILL